jgi:hypothetical protein
MTFFLAWNLTEKITECIDGIINVFFNRKRRYFNNLIRWFGLVSAISWRSLLMMEEPGVPGENHGPVASHWQTFSHNVVSLKWHSNSQVSDDRCKSNYHTITTTTAPSTPIER